MPPVKVAIVEKDVFHRPRMPLGSSRMHSRIPTVVKSLSWRHPPATTRTAISHHLLWSACPARTEGSHTSRWPSLRCMRARKNPSSGLFLLSQEHLPLIAAAAKSNRLYVGLALRPPLGHAPSKREQTEQCLLMKEVSRVPRPARVSPIRGTDHDVPHGELPEAMAGPAERTRSLWKRPKEL